MAIESFIAPPHSGAALALDFSKQGYLSFDLWTAPGPGHAPPACTQCKTLVSCYESEGPMNCPGQYWKGNVFIFILYIFCHGLLVPCFTESDNYLNS